VHCNHCFQHDCNLQPTYADGAGNLAVFRNFLAALAQSQYVSDTVLIPTSAESSGTRLGFPLRFPT
jgi:hypothetical protein